MDMEICGKAFSQKATFQGTQHRNREMGRMCRKGIWLLYSPAGVFVLYMRVSHGVSLLFTLQSRMPVYIAHTPAGTSVQNIVHLSQVGCVPTDRQTDRQTDRPTHVQSHANAHLHAKMHTTLMKCLHSFSHH